MPPSSTSAPVVGYPATDMRQIQRQTNESSCGRQFSRRLPDTTVIEPRT
jgi:hypothetical protein